MTLFVPNSNPNTSQVLGLSYIPIVPGADFAEGHVRHVFVYLELSTEVCSTFPALYILCLVVLLSWQVRVEPELHSWFPRVHWQYPWWGSRQDSADYVKGATGMFRERGRMRPEQ